MSNTDKDDLRPEYDLDELKNKEVGKYYESYKAGVNVVVIEPDLIEAFPNAKAVNDALRELLSQRKRGKA
jgi:outer membrane protein assembly factor BamD (BamD/ComL family)